MKRMLFLHGCVPCDSNKTSYDCCCKPTAKKSVFFTKNSKKNNASFIKVAYVLYIGYSLDLSYLHYVYLDD